MATGIGTRTAAMCLALLLSGSGKHLAAAKKQNTPLGKPGGVYCENQIAEDQFALFTRSARLPTRSRR
jgi:hypothetical protein